MKIYFEKGPLHSLTEFINITPPTIITCHNGYRSMIIDSKNAIQNSWDIYTNELSILGETELFGSKFLHKIMIRNSKEEWVEFNPYILKKLSTPTRIEQFFRRFICK